MNNMVQRVLSIGDPVFASSLFPESTVDSTSMKPKGGQNGYDALVSYLALPRVHSSRAVKTIGWWKDALKPGGNLHIFVPSLEWAAAQVLSETPSLALQMHLYGGDVPNNYLSAYSMIDLRILCEMNGLAVTYARVGQYEIQNGENVYQCDTNYVMAVKP